MSLRTVLCQVADFGMSRELILTGPLLETASYGTVTHSALAKRRALRIYASEQVMRMNVCVFHLRRGSRACRPHD